MTPVSIIKIVAAASVSVTACSAALVFGVAHLQHADRLVEDTVTAAIGAPKIDAPKIDAPKTAPAVRSDAPPAAAEPPARTEAQAQTALAAATTDTSVIAATLAGPPNATGEDKSAPSFDIARVEAEGDAVIAGRAPPGATVDLMRGGERLDRAIADAAGEFAMVPPRDRKRACRERV